MQVLIIGCGYLGRRAGGLWRDAGHAVSVLTRSATRAAEWRQAGLTPYIGDVLLPDSLAALPAADVLLYAVGYDRSAGADKRQVYVDGLRHTLAAVGRRVGRVIYISSSSVYGQTDGEWVDETSPTNPGTEGGEICLAAEEVLRSFSDQHARPHCILRLTGIYGPGRLLAKAETLRQGLALSGSPEAWLNLIHVADAARICVAAADHPQPEPLYLVTDDEPVTRGAYYSELARLVEAPPPRFDSAQTPRHGQGLNKRCRNRLLKMSLGLKLDYPSIREGLPASLRDE